jgi:hypothetical protein
MPPCSLSGLPNCSWSAGESRHASGAAGKPADFWTRATEGLPRASRPNPRSRTGEAENGKIISEFARGRFHRPVAWSDAGRLHSRTPPRRACRNLGMQHPGRPAGRCAWEALGMPFGTPILGWLQGRPVGGDEGLGPGSGAAGAGGKRAPRISPKWPKCVPDRGRKHCGSLWLLGS